MQGAIKILHHVKISGEGAALRKGKKMKNWMPLE